MGISPKMLESYLPGAGDKRGTHMSLHTYGTCSTDITCAPAVPGTLSGAGVTKGSRHGSRFQGRQDSQTGKVSYLDF